MNEIKEAIDTILPYIKIISFLASVVLVCAIISLRNKVKKFGEKVEKTIDAWEEGKATKELAIAMWEQVQKKIESGNEAELKLAVIEADKILDEVLKAMKLEGEGFAERLEKLSVKEIPNIQALWDAHKIRNRIVHEAAYHLRSDVAGRCLETYARTLKSLKILE